MNPRDRRALEAQLKHLTDKQLRALIERDIQLEKHHQRRAGLYSARANVVTGELRRREDKNEAA